MNNLYKMLVTIVRGAVFALFGVDVRIGSEQTPPSTFLKQIRPIVPIVVIVGGLSIVIPQVSFLALIGITALDVANTLIKRIRGLERTGKPSPNTERSLRAGEMLLYLFLDKKQCDGIIGDLEESFRDMQTAYGDRFARTWYWKQILTSLWPLISKAGKRLLGLGVAGWLKHIGEHLIR